MMITFVLNEFRVMKKGLLLVLSGFFVLGGFASCEQCMTCEITYTKTNGEEEIETSPQKCGYPWQLDEKEDELEDAYSTYDSLRVDCNRDR
jgi:hypothetical protein